jgi:hypothetical protein
MEAAWFLRNGGTHRPTYMASYTMWYLHSHRPEELKFHTKMVRTRLKRSDP